jgi:hypothetical protein
MRFPSVLSRNAQFEQIFDQCGGDLRIALRRFATEDQHGLPGVRPLSEANLTSHRRRSISEVAARDAIIPRPRMSLIPPLRRMVDALKSTGNPKSRRIASNIQLELLRTQADPELNWDSLVALAQREKDDMSMAQATNIILIQPTGGCCSRGSS